VSYLERRSERFYLATFKLNLYLVFPSLYYFYSLHTKKWKESENFAKEPTKEKIMMLQRLFVRSRESEKEKKLKAK
jgi:hypothetical protein